MPTPPTKARHVECTLDEYHAMPGWSNSQLNDLVPPEGSPPLFDGRHVTGIYPRKVSKEMDVGSVAHILLSNPADATNLVAVIPRDALNSQGNRTGSAWQAFKAEHADTRYLLKRAEYAPIKQMVANVYDCPAAKPLMESAIHYEFSLTWQDEETGLHLRARPDMICGHAGRVVVPDFKTTKALTPWEFTRDALKYGYHRQGAWYSEPVELFGYDVAGFVFITVDKSPAHEVRVYELPERALQLGREQNRANRRELARRLDQDDWSDPLGAEILVVDLPERAYSEQWSMT